MTIFEKKREENFKGRTINSKEEIYFWLNYNLKLLEEKIGCEIEQNTIKMCFRGIQAKEKHTERVIYLNIYTKKFAAGDFGEVIHCSAIYDASVVVIIAPTLTELLKDTVKWLNVVTNKEIKFFALPLDSLG